MSSEESLDKDDFEKAFEQGFDSDDSDDSSFDDEPVSERIEDDVDRIDLGISGLDEMIRGGVPEGSTMSVIGDAGTGKTTFSMQFLYEGLRNDEKAVFFSLEQTKDEIITTADDKGWEFSKYEESGDLVVVHMDPVEVATSLRSIRSELPRMVSDFGASRVVLDSVTLIEMMFSDYAEGRNQVFRFMKQISDAGATTLVTSEASEDSPYRSRYGTVEYLSDAVFILKYVRTDSASETRLALEINKIRNTSHSREVKPYELTDEGIKVYSNANIF